MEIAYSITPSECHGSILSNNKYNTIVLNTLMRSLLCEAICSKLDIVAFFHTHLHMELEPDTTNPILASGCCPWCGSALERQELTFFLNTKTGQCNCTLCNRDDDFLSILCEKKRMDLCSATYYLSALLEGDLNFSNLTIAGRG